MLPGIALAIIVFWHEHRRVPVLPVSFGAGPKRRGRDSVKSRPRRFDRNCKAGEILSREPLSRVAVSERQAQLEFDSPVTRGVTAAAEWTATASQAGRLPKEG